MPALPPQNRFRVAITGFALICSALLAPAAQAQLYTWKDAQGNVIVKNSPPPWYDGTDWVRGARVQVLLNGKVIDDTAWPAERRQDLRRKSALDEIKRAQAASQAAETTKKDDDDDDGRLINRIGAAIKRRN